MIKVTCAKCQKVMSVIDSEGSSITCEECGKHELRVIAYNNDNNASMDIQDIITLPLKI